MAETMENFTIRVPRGMRRQIEEIAQRDRRRPSEWARLQLERAIEQFEEDDESGDMTHEEVVAELLARGMVTQESLEAARNRWTEEDFRRAGELFDQDKQWW